jgi:nucleotide-binding universal stress UspA family protein
MNVFARIVVGVDGTDWGFEALRQALVLAPKEKPVLHAVTALDTAPAIHTGFHAAHFAELLEKEAEEARDTAETIIGNREGCTARVARGKPVDVLRRERDELQATLVALGGRRSSRFLGIMLGDTGTELVPCGRPMTSRTPSTGRSR